MKLFLPYTIIQPATRIILSTYNYEPVLMTGEDDYLNYFKQRWQEGESFINCEHDTVFWHGAVEELERCPEEWCAYGQYGQGFGEGQFVDGEPPTLALMKFRAEFIEKYPDVWDLMPANNPLGPTPKWQWCDTWLSMYTKEKGIVCHQHFPPVANVHLIRGDVSIQL